MNIRVHISQVFLFSSGKYPGVELLDHMVVLFLIFWGISILFSLVAAPIYNATNSAQGFSFLYILPNTFYLLSFDNGYYVWGDISSWFWCAFPWWLTMLSISPVPLGHLYVFLGKMSTDPLAILQLGCSCFLCWAVWVLLHFWY